MADLVVSDVAALAIAKAIEAQTIADGINNKLLIASNEKLFGSLAKKASAGGIVSQAANVVISLDDIRNKLQAQADASKNMEVAINNLIKSIDIQTKAIANIQSTQIKRLQTEQLVAVDTLKANQHQQAVVADSRAEQGKDPIVITPEQKKLSYEESQKAIIDMRASQSIQTLIEQYFIEAYADGKKMTLTWYAESGLEKWLADNYLIAKGQVMSLFSTEKVKEATQTVQAKAEQLSNDPTKKTA